MIKRLSLSVPMDGFAMAELGEVAREAERLGYLDTWSFEVDGVDCFLPLALVGVDTQMRLGTAIANVYTRGPATLAMQAAGVAEVAPGRFCLGIGSGSQVIVEAWNGGRFARPATRVREMAQALRAILAGERVVWKGETVQVDGFRLSRPPAERVPIYVAALRPGMLRVAGEVGDGVILNWLAPEDVPRSVAVVREAARQAGRDPDAIEVCARIFVNLDPIGPESDLVMRRHVAAYLNVPVYRAFQEWLGRSESLGPMWSAWGAGDRRGAVAAIPPAVVDDLMVRGPHARMRERIRRYLGAGIDTVYLQFSTSEPDAGKKRRMTLDAIRALAPGSEPQAPAR